MFLNIDIIDLKRINFIMLKNKIYINLCDIIIIINFKSRLRDVIIKFIIINK